MKKSDKVLNFLEDIVAVLTFKRVALIAVLTVIGVALWSLYDHKEAIVAKMQMECPK